MSVQEETNNKKKMISGGYAIARMLKEHGVSYIFGIPDGHSLAFYDGVQKIPELHHILVNDERTAAFAADAFARVTGNIAVCDAGPAGAMNFPVALVEANGAASPVLALASTVKSRDMLRNVPHDINVTDVFTPITKWTGQVLNTENLPRFLNYALRQAVNGRPGPVGLVVAEDILNAMEYELEDFVPQNGGSCSINGCRSAPAGFEIENAVELIRKSNQPAIFSGGGAVLSGASDEILALATLLKCPIFSTISGKGIAVPRGDDQNLYFGTIGLFGEKPNHKFLRQNCDLLIVVGNRLTEDDTANFKVPPQRLPMIQIDIDAKIIGLSFHPWGIVGDPKESVREIIEILKERGIKESSQIADVIKKRNEALKLLREDHVKFREKDIVNWITAEPIKPQRVLKAISDLFSEYDYLVTDASASSRWIGPYFPVKSIGRKIITARGTGPTGFGLGALIGTCFALKSGYVDHASDAKIVLFTGDGGLMNGGIADFETIVKYQLNCCIIVINNSALGYVKYGQGMLYQQKYFETDRPTTNFAELAKVFGGKGYRVQKLAELDSTIRIAINSPGFNLVDVEVDPKELLPPNFY